MKRFLGGCALLLLGVGAAAQPVGTHLYLALGARHLATHDQAASPLIYRGTALPLALGVTQQGARHAWAIDLGFATTVFNAQPLVNQADREVYSWDQLQAGFTYRRALGDRGGLRHWLGARLAAWGFVRTYDFLDGISWEILATLDLGYGVTWPLAARQWLRAEGFLSLAGYTNRPPYFLASPELFAALYDGEGSFLGLGRFATWPDLRQGTVRLQYGRQVGPRWVVAAALAARAYRLADPEPITTLQRTLSLRLAYRL